MEQEPVWKRAFNAIDSNKGEVAGLGTEVAAGLALDAKTAKLLAGGPLGWAAYGVINFGGGASANIAAQKLRGEEDLNWGEVISSGLLGIIPFTSLRFNKKATRILGRRNTFQRAITGGAGMGVGDRFIQSGINEGELPSAGEVATGALAGATFGGTFQQVGKRINTKLSKSKLQKNLPKDVEGMAALLTKAQNEGDTETLGRLVFEYHKANNPDMLGGFNSYDEYIQRRANVTNQALDSINGDPIRRVWTDPINGRQYNIEGLDDRASEQLTNWSKREASDWASIQGLRAAGKSYDEIYAQYPDLTRRFTGTAPLNELIEIAENNNIPFSKVYEYKNEQEVNYRNLTLLTNAFNILDNDQLQVEATYALRKAVDKGIIAPSVVREYNQIINQAKKKKLKFHSIGHLQSLKQMWDKGLRGGDRSTNLISEPFMNYLAEVEPGLWVKLKGNAARQNIQDWPQYTLERLTDYNVDLEEDFVRFSFPELGIIGDLQESGLSRRVASEFQGAAALQFNTLRSEIIDEVNKMEPHPIFSKSKLIKEYQRALTTAIADFYIENAPLIIESGFSDAKLKTLITAPETGIIPRFEAQVSNLGSEFKNILNNSDLNNPKALSKFVRLLRRFTKKNK